MPLTFDNPLLGQTIEAIYAAAVAPGQWASLLGRLAALFDSHFADVFARTDDYRRFHGLAHGLDRSDYEDQFLGVWVSRNVWGQKRPVAIAGEVISTRMMMTKAELVRTEMYGDYLARRGLHEGLRLAIWSGEGWIQDVSLLRSWSAGPFEAREIALARLLLPHLCRAASVARELRAGAALAESGFAALDAVGAAAFLLAADGRVVRFNRAADRLLAAADGLKLARSRLAAAQDGATARLEDAVTHGIATRSGATVCVPRPSGRPALTIAMVPLAAEQDWLLLRPPALLAVVRADPPTASPDGADLAALFGLTAAEIAVAQGLLAGLDAGQIAARRGRSVHTVRTHLARLMGKTQTNRQSELVRVLMGAAPTAPDRPGPVFG